MKKLLIVAVLTSPLWVLATCKHHEAPKAPPVFNEVWDAGVRQIPMVPKEAPQVATVLPKPADVRPAPRHKRTQRHHASAVAPLPSLPPADLEVVEPVYPTLHCIFPLSLIPGCVPQQ